MAHEIYHIKVDWETLQIYLKSRDKLDRPMAGPNPPFGVSVPSGDQADYKGRRALKSCLFGVSSHPLVWLFYTIGRGRKRPRPIVFITACTFAYSSNCLR